MATPSPTDGNDVAASPLPMQGPSSLAQGLLQGQALSNVDPGHQAAAAAVLANNPSFDISKDRVESLAGAAELSDQAQAALRAVQRVQNVAADPDTVAKLVNANFTSAAKIAAMPASEFARALPHLPAEVAAQVHANARGIVHRNEMFLASVAPSAVAESAPILKALSANDAADQAPASAAAAAVVNLDTLFGSAVTTRCDDCSSVLSPAAYLVDLLDFLPAGARDEVLRRRPDLRALELSCANTNTEVLYLDLVNEVMEAFLAKTPPAGLAAYNNNNDGRVGPGELAAEPQNVSLAAYEALAGMVSPVGLLPFDRELEQTRILLEKLGTSREEILATFSGSRGGEGARDAPTERALTAELLGLPRAEYVALTGESFTPKSAADSPEAYSAAIGERRVHEYWGFATQRQMLSDASGLCRVKAQFLRLTGYDYDDVANLLQTRFVRGGNVPEVLLQAGLSLEAMWKLVDWSAVDPWTELARALPVESVDSQRGAALVKGLVEMANMPVIMPVQTSMPPRSDLALQQYRRWPLTGPVYFGPDTRKDPIGYLGETGYVHASPDEGAPLVAYFDEDGVFRTRAGGEDLADDPPAYSDPAWAGDSFYVRAAGVTAQLLREAEGGGPEGPTVVTNGEMQVPGIDHTRLRLDAERLAQGPRSVSPVAGWSWEPLPGEGEPAADLLTIRTMSGQPLSVEQWGRINRFVRLQKRLGWSISETDDALSTLGAEDIDADVLQKLSAVKLLRRLSGLSLANTLVLVGEMSTSLYKTLFLKSSILGRDPAGGRFALSRAGEPNFTLPADTAPPTLAEHAATVGAAMGMRPIEVAGMLGAIGLQTAPLSLASISALFRNALLCRALGQPPTELRGLLAAFGEDPFRDAEATVRFLRCWRRLLSAYNLRPSQWAYIATGEDYTGGYKPSTSLVLHTSLAIATAHDKKTPDSETPNSDAPAGEGKGEGESNGDDDEKSPASDSDTSVGRGKGETRAKGDDDKKTPASDTPVGEDKGDTDGKGAGTGGQPTTTAASAQSRALDGTRAILGALFDKVSADVVSLLLSESSLAELVPSPAEPPTGPFTGFFVPPATGDYEIGEARPPAQGVSETEPESSGEPVVVVHPLASDQPLALDTPISLVGGQFYRIQARYQGSSFTMKYKNATGTVPASCLVSSDIIDKVEAVVVLLSRYDVLLGGLGIPAADVGHLLSFTRLPASAKTGSWTHEQILELAAYDAVRSTLTSTSTSTSTSSAARLSALLPLTTFESEDAAVADLVGITGWDAGLVASLMPALRIGGGSGSPLAVNISALDRLRSAYDLCVKMGVHDAAPLFRWAKPDAPSAAEAAAGVRTLARSRVDQAAWEATAAALFDPLRRASRDALVAACLAAMPGLQDAGSLFEYFLIDVSMGACLKTSRIRQAISSIQIFVQRCLLGLEVTPRADLDLATWEWKKSYATWQANRKVLLYPENWLEPSLRDDKSEVFAAVEAALDQGAVSSADVLAKYAAGMLEVADLEPVALHSGPGRDHIFARTRMAPHKFFYRSYDRSAFAWSPWESVQIDIPTVQAVRTYRQAPDHVRSTAANKVVRLWSQADVSAAMRDHPSRPVASGSYLAPATLGGSDDRLVVFIPTLTQRTYSYRASDTRQLGPGEADASYTRCYWEVGMAFSERKEGKWTPRQLAPEVIAARDSTGQVQVASGMPVFPKFRLQDTTADDALLEQPGFLFIPKAEPGGTVSIAAYASRYRFVLVNEPEVLTGLPAYVDGLYANPDMHPALERLLLNQTESKNPIRIDTPSGRVFDYSLTAHFLGEFVLEGGHIHLRPQSASGAADGSRDGVLQADTHSEAQDWLFQAVIKATGAGGGGVGDEEREIRTLRERSSLGSYSGLVSVETLPKAPPTDTVPEGWTDEQWRLRQQWAKQTAVRPRTTVSGTLLPAALSNNFAAELHALANSASPSAVFDYFRDRLWPRSYRIDGQASQNPTSVVDQGLGRWDIALVSQYHELGTPTALYNWELCVHLPMLLVSTYLGQQRFDDALEAVKYVFDPTIPDGEAAGPGGAVDHRMWRFLPFRKLANQNGLRPAAGVAAGDVDEWAKHPFDPFAIARRRHTAVMKWFVYKYIEAMIGKGDAYFRRFTLEDIGLAIQCYIEAAHLYGPKPQTIASAGKKGRLTVEGMLAAEPQWDSLDNVLVNMETLFPFRNQATATSTATPPKANVFGTATAKYFCVPANPALVGLRATIDDRLYKIRHCQDIDGNVRSLALWEPPLDPGALVRGVAGGAPLGSVLGNTSASPLPNYRFASLLRDAFYLCDEVKALGERILSLRERRDAELLASLQVRQQGAVAKMVLDLRAKEVDEAQAVLEAQHAERAGAVERMRHYLGLLGEDDSLVPGEGEAFSGLAISNGSPSKDSGLPLSKYETTEVELSRAGLLVSSLSHMYELMGGVAALIPDETVEAAPMGVGASVEFGGRQLSAAMGFAASAGRTVADTLSWGSANAGRFAQFQRQTQERQLMANTAGREIATLDGHIRAQRMRVDQARQRLAMDRQALDHNDEMDAFLRSKYTNQELYTWGVNCLQKLYYTAYNLALDVASQAEAAFRFERGLPPLAAGGEREFVRGGYWNASNDGLYAGEQLSLALFRLQRAHAAARPHDFELARSVSLRQVNPRALLSLRTTGSTGAFSLPEVLWDLDFPGHYGRRIASVSVSVPCVAGPYAPLNATLRLASHSIRISQDVGPNGYTTTGGGDARFHSASVPMPYTAVSSAQNDAGVFDLSFRDERYMPFEGAGVISDWVLELGGVASQFAHGTIADVVLHIRYTALQGDANLAQAARASALSYLFDAAAASASASPLALFAELRAEFATAWAAFRATGRLELQGLHQRLPYFARAAGTASVVSIGLAVEMAAGSKSTKRRLALSVGKEEGPTFGLTKALDVQTLGEDKAGLQVSWPAGAPADSWVFTVAPLEGGADAAAVARDIVAAQLIVAYRLEMPSVEGGKR